MTESKCPVECAVCGERACPYESILLSHSSEPQMLIYLHHACDDAAGRAKLTAKFKAVVL